MNTPAFAHARNYSFHDIVNELVARLYGGRHFDLKKIEKTESKIVQSYAVNEVDFCMFATYLEGNLCYVLLVVNFKSLVALNWEIFPFLYFLWRSFDAAMSKLSFRARALDANKSLPVYHEKDVPDLPDIASVNRVVPQMPTGMEKEEESVSK